MTLPPHGPPEITEAQQAATSLGEVEDPTPDNVSRALQDYSSYAVAAAAASLGASGGGGGSQPVSCLLAMDAAYNIRTATQFPIFWDALYDNAAAFNTLADIPAGLGLTFLFDGSSPDITTTEAGAWSFSYNINRNGDDTWEGQLQTAGIGRDFQLVGTTASDSSTTVTDVLALPAATTISPKFNVTTQATANPYTAHAYLSIVRLG